MGEIVTKDARAKSLHKWVAGQAGKLAASIPDHMKTRVNALQAGFYRCCLADPRIMDAVSNRPDLALTCLLDAARNGLSMGTTMGSDSHLLAYAGTPTLVVNFRGLLKLAYQSGDVLSVQAEAVVVGDVLEYQLGADPFVRHRKAGRSRPTPNEDNLEFAWAIVELKGGGRVVEVMSHAEIEAVRTASSGGNSPAWKQWYGEQSKKTVIKRALKKCPRSESLAKLMELDDRAQAGKSGEPVMADDLERSFVDVDAEVTDSPPPPRQEQQAPQQDRARPRGAASDKQRKAIWACVNKGLGMDGQHDAIVRAVVPEREGLDDEALTSKEASAVLDIIKRAEDGDRLTLDALLSPTAEGDEKEGAPW